MSENSNPNDLNEKNQQMIKDNNKLNYSFSPNNNSNSKKNKKEEKESEKEIKFKKSITKGKILEGQFIIGEEIGKGTFGVVRLATHIITGEKVAVKILYREKIKEKSDKRRLEREIKILKILRHKNIVQLYNVIQTPSTIYLVMEYIKGKELFEIIVQKKKLSELESLRYFQQLISGIEYLGKIRVAHRDLKPENLLIDSKNNLKIADFGLSNIYKNNELLSTDCGSPCYAAPEMLSGEKYFGLSADIWSSGIILYTMLCGRLPFEDKDNQLLYNKIKEGNFKIPEFLSENAKDILTKIINVDPKKRYTISQIKKHPWFNQLDQRKYMSKGLLLNKFIVPIDEDIVNKMENEYEYNSKEIRINLLGNKHNHITTTYYLILKKKIKNGISSICDMTSNEFLNYIHNPKNLLGNYNGDWNKLFKERGIKKKIEKNSTFKSNNSNNNNSIKNENKNKNIIEINNNNNDVIINNKTEDNIIKNEENNNNSDKNKNKIKTNFYFENKNNEFKEKIDEIYKQKILNNPGLNVEIKNKEINDSDINNKNINMNININNLDSKKSDIIQNKKNDNICKYKNEIISIDLEEINKKNYTPSNEKEREQNNNNINIYVKTISFSGNSNNKNLNTLNKTKSSNSKNSDNSNKHSLNVSRFKMKKNKNSKSVEKGNKIKKKSLLINLNKINIENKNIKNKYLKNERNKPTQNNIDISKNKKELINLKTIPNNKVTKNLKKNNSSKIIYYLNNKNQKLLNNNNIKKTKNNKNNLINNKYKSTNKDKIKSDMNKNSKVYDIDKCNIINDNKLSNKIIPSFSISNNKISYNQNTNYSKKISIEGIYYAHKKNLQEINNLYNKISNQNFKKSSNSLKNFL